MELQGTSPPVNGDEQETMDHKMVTTTIKLPRSMYNDLVRLVYNHDYPTIAEAVRQAVRDLLFRLRNGEEVPVRECMEPGKIRKEVLSGPEVHNSGTKYAITCSKCGYEVFHMMFPPGDSGSSLVKAIAVLTVLSNEQCLYQAELSRRVYPWACGDYPIHASSTFRRVLRDLEKFGYITRRKYGKINIYCINGELDVMMISTITNYYLQVWGGDNDGGESK